MSEKGDDLRTERRHLRVTADISTAPNTGMIVPIRGIPEVEFRAELAEIRLKCERVLAQQPSVEQLVALGAELQAQTDSILRDLSDKGLMWRP